MDRLDGRTALVTGAASGIGRACAERLAAAGAVVWLTDLNPLLGEGAAEAIRQSGGAARFRAHDVTDEAQWIETVTAIEATDGRLDILVNNAGIAVSSASITEMSLADFRRQEAVNVDGVFLGLKHVIPAMRRGGRGGSIINMSSVAGLKGSPVLAAYCATKGAVRLLTKAVALECGAAGDGVRVNSVHPGIIETPIWMAISGSTSAGANAPPDLDAMSALSVPLGKKGVPADIAEGVVWLASDSSRYVTGAEIVIDGGLSIR